MLVYYSTELLKELLDYYLPRFRLAEERGFAVQGSKYAWLYDELRLRVSTIRQALLFLDSLPKFMECEDNSKNGRIDLSSPSYTDEEHFLQRIKRAVYLFCYKISACSKE